MAPLRTLISVVQASPEVAQWWESFRQLAPDWAKTAAQLRVLTSEGLRRIESPDSTDKRFELVASGGEGWVSFAEDEIGFTEVACAILRSVFRFGDVEVSALMKPFVIAIDKADKKRFAWLREWIDAALNWSVYELEARLATTLEEAYTTTPTRPLWMDDMSRPKEQEEPRRFLAELLDGVVECEPEWTSIAVTVFGGIPERHLLAQGSEEDERED